MAKMEKKFAGSDEWYELDMNTLEGIARGSENQGQEFDTYRYWMDGFDTYRYWMDSNACFMIAGDR